MEDNKVKSILDELYDCNLFRLIRLADVGDEYRKAMERLLKAETELLKALHDCSEPLDEYQSAEIDLTDLSNRYEFSKGFRLGAQLVLEMIKLVK